jgi:hypothetical protein
MTAREARFAAILGNKVNQVALRARPLLFAVFEVEAGRRILEHKTWSPGVTATRAVAAPIEENQFPLQNLQKLSDVGHLTSPCDGDARMARASVTPVTVKGDSGHGNPPSAFVKDHLDR